MDAASESACPACRRWWRLPVLLALVLVAIVLSKDRLLRERPRNDGGSSSAQSGSGEAREHISLAIDFGDGNKKSFGPIAWHEGMTVSDALGRLPAIAVREKGEGPTAFLVSIDGVANDDAAGRYWMYRVNGKVADRTFATYRLQPGDDVLWTFGERQ